MLAASAVERRVLAVLDGVAGHWLFGLNVAVAIFVLGAGLAPVLAAAGWSAAAEALYAAYHATCHQWAFRSFFVLGGQMLYARDELQALGQDPFTFVGGPGYGWKVAFCERDLAIYLSLLGFGLFFSLRRGLPAAGFLVYALLTLPMALDGFTQLFGWRESTWELRVITGALFGAASGWLLFPRFDAALRAYPADTSCAGPVLRNE